MNKFQLKDRVCLVEDVDKLGMVVQLIGKGKCKILWDKDWQTGRTYVYSNKQIRRAG